MQRIDVEIADGIHHIALDRADKRNAFDRPMLGQLAEALTAFEDDDAGRVAVLSAKGEHFTGGLELTDVGPAFAEGEGLFPAGSVNPLGTHGRRRNKPLIMAVQGWCLTIGIELLLASDIRIAAADARFGQIEINRGIFPFGGATVRLPQVAGWGNAMRWLLTGDIFDAAEAYRIGLVQEVVEPGEQTERALQLARVVASRAPLGVRATLASSRIAVERSPEAAFDALPDQARALMATEDAAEGMKSFMERREGRFQGR
ncbi:MAG: crotonase/enoyl-CoA hydratase family protein [Myxococcales bacterium]|nr:crotonase/enoyl-CoA hydratase family protein [Myxococcales bacterium]